MIFVRFSSDSKKKDPENDESEEEFFYPQPPKLASREFFNLLQTCLKGHEDQRDVLLSSLHKQLQHFVRSMQDVSTTTNNTFYLIFRQIAFLLK